MNCRATAFGCRFLVWQAERLPYNNQLRHMNLNDLANLGQIIGAIGVMITIVYLAIQIRGNTKVASAQASMPSPSSFFASRFFERSMQIDLPSLRVERN